MATDCCECCCFFLRRSRKDPKPTTSHLYKHYSGEHLLAFSVAEEDRLTHSSARHGAKSTFNNYCLPSDNNASIRIGYNRSMSPSRAPFKEWRGSPRIPQLDNTGENLAQHILVKENNLAVLSQDSNGNKMINEYVRECKIGTGSYGKVVLHRSKKDGKQYAIKMFHKSRLRKLRVSPTETAMMDVLREVAIMKQLDHPNVVHLVEVIDDPENDRFYMAYLVVADEEFGRQIPFTFLERIKEDFKRRYLAGNGTVTPAVGKEFGVKLKEHMQYCVEHPEEMNKISKIKSQVAEVKGIMMDNIEKVLDRGEKIELLVDKTENLKSQADNFQRQGKQLRRKMWFQNFKVKLIVLAIIIVIILIIYLSICHGFVCHSSSSNKA